MGCETPVGSIKQTPGRDGASGRGGVPAWPLDTPGLPAIGVVFANDAGDPRDAPVQNIIVNSVTEDVPSARAVLSAAAPVLGLDAAAVDRFFERLREGKAEDSGRVFDGRPAGYLRPTVEIFYRGSERRVAINYRLSWDEPSPSAGPSAAPA